MQSAGWPASASRNVQCCVSCRVRPHAAAIYRCRGQRRATHQSGWFITTAAMMTDSLTATQWPDRVQTASVVRTSNRIRTIRQQTCVKHHGGHYYYSKRTKSSLDWLPGTCHCSPVLFLFCFFLPFSLVLSSCRGDEPAVPSEHHHQDRSTVVDLPPIDLAVPISDDSTRPSAVDPAETGDWGEDGQRSARSRSRRHCPSCQMTGSSDLQHQQQRHKPPLEQEQEQTAGDSARLESIKRQILVKLGLNAKPDLLSTMPPRDFILETLLRAEESTVAAAPAVRPPSSSRSDHHHHHHHSSSSSDSGGTDLNSVEDDFYGKTSEIIAFGEPGECRCWTRVHFSSLDLFCPANSSS